MDSGRRSDPRRTDSMAGLPKWYRNFIIPQSWGDLPAPQLLTCFSFIKSTLAAAGEGPKAGYHLASCGGLLRATPRCTRSQVTGLGSRGQLLSLSVLGGSHPRVCSGLNGKC
jgi:hypothetical protein